jgi:predicted O-methyltransferase YrrM
MFAFGDQDVKLLDEIVSNPQHVDSMAYGNELSTESSLIRKVLFAILKGASSPRSTLSWIYRGHLAKDPAVIQQTYWFTGGLPRVPLRKILPGSENSDVTVPRAFDRQSGTSITVEEACHLGAVAKFINARKVLEIGTYDGNSSLVLAANVDVDGSVITVDLPPDFTMEDRSSLVHAVGELNLTPRDQLARQHKIHELGARVRQVYGDSAKLDWATLGGPFDLIFIDGSHEEKYVRSDSENALKHLRPGGIILWHDYGLFPAVSRVVDSVAKEARSMKAYVLEGTRLAIGLT